MPPAPPAPPEATDHFAPTVIVGNVPAGDPAAAQAAPFQYVPDPGDGTGIAAALAAVPAGGGWVHIRRGTYTLAAGVLPLTLPSGCRVTGDGPGATVLVARADDRRVFAVGGVGGDSDIELSAIGFTLPAAAVGATGLTMIDAGFGQRVRLVNLRVAGPGTAFDPNESLTSIIRAGGSCLVQQCHISAMPHAANANLACVRIPGFGANTRVVDNFIEGGDLEILADGASGAATGLHILNNYCLGNANVNSCIALAVGGSQQFVRGNRCISGDVGILYSANGGHVSENQCYGQLSNPIVLNSGAIICVGNTVSAGAVILDQGIGNVVAHNAQF